MASGAQIDKQREERWPNQTAAGSFRVKVEHEESDYESSDDEEIGPRVGYDPKTGKLYGCEADDQAQDVEDI